MKSEKVILWVQVLGGFALLVGLVLVILELQQARELAKLQIVSDGWSDHMENLRAQMGETFSETRAKACFSPERLTEAEVMEMTKYNQLLLAQIRRKREFVDLGSTNDMSLDDLTELNIAAWLYTKVGRADYATMKDLDPVMKDVAERLLKDGLTTCTEEYRPYLEAIRADRDPLIPEPHS